MKTKKQDQALMSILKVTEINRIICETNMGVLKLQIRKGENEYRFLLDSVPLPKDVHKEIYELLYAPEIPQVIQGSSEGVAMLAGNIIPKAKFVPRFVASDKQFTKPEEVGLIPPKPKGRLVGSKNKTK